MADFGAQLKQARDLHGVSLREIALKTKISMTVLEALERGDFGRLPGGIFSRAFVRAYATEVGLDPERTVQQFLVEYERYEREAAARVPSPEVTADDREFLARQQRAAKVLRIAVLVAIVIAAGIVTIWQLRLRDKRAAAREVAETTQSTAPPVVSPEPPPPAPIAAPAIAAATPVVSSSPTRAPGAPVTTASPDQLAIHVETAGDSWIRLTVDGAVQFEGILKAGDRRDFKPGREVYVQLGNAGAVSWTINGRPARPLGKAGDAVAVRLTAANVGKYLQPQ
jgi:cytoskeletal protein RodZ